MTPCTARLGSILSAGIVLTSISSIAHAARVTASPRAIVTYDIGISVPLLQLPELAYGISHGVDVAIA